MLRDATQRAFFEVLDQNEIPYSFNKSENHLVFRDLGSEIFFRSLDEYERLRGTNLAWFAVDELTYTQEGAWLRLLGRMRHPKAKRLQGFASWTPKGYDWVYRSFIGPDKRSGYEAILATPRENTHLPAEFYDELAKSYDPKFFAQEVLGDYLSLSGNRVYYAFDRTASIKPLELTKHQEIYWSLDFNVNPMCSVIAQVEDLSSRMDIMAGRRERRLHVIDEIVLPDANLGEACNEFIRRTERMAQYGQIQVKVYGDASGGARTHAGPSSWQLVMDHFRNDNRYRLQKHVASANPPVKDRVNAMNAMLLNSAGDRRMFVDPRCKELVSDFEQVQWKQDSAGNQTADLNKADKKRTHVSDSLGYLAEKEFGVRQQGGPRSGFVA